MIWLIFALLSPLLYGLCNVIDNHFVNRLFDKTHTLVFFTALINLLFLPIVFILDSPTMITMQELPYFLILGMTNIIYLYPYYQALKKDDTSTVVSLFSLGKIFVPLFAFLFLGEVLNTQQYIGFAIIVLSATLLTFNGEKKFRPNRSLYWMILCTMIIALEAVIFKKVFSTMSWGTGFTWATIFSFLYASLLLVVPQTRKQIGTQLHKFKNNSGLFILEEFLNFSGMATTTFAMSLASITLVSAIGSFQSIIVLTYTITLGKIFPRVFKEKITARQIIKKIILFIMMILGVIMIVK